MISIFVHRCVSQQICTPKTSTLLFAAEHVKGREGGGETGVLIQLLTADCRGGAFSWVTSAGAAAGDHSHT